jgi:hypothetical protein
VVKEDAIAKRLYLPLTREEARQHKEKVRTAKRDERFLALTWILEHRTYREVYSSWEEFLNQELVMSLTDWEREKRQARIQMLLEERGIKMQINQAMSGELNKVRDDPEVFVAVVSEFQAMPASRQNAKRLREIVERHLARKSKLSSLRQLVPNATPAEADILAPISGNAKWRGWGPEVQKLFRERVEAGRPPRECLLELATEHHVLPDAKALLAAARGVDLVPLVNDLTGLIARWDEEQVQEDKRKKWLEEGAALGLYDPDTGEIKPGGEAKQPAANPQAGGLGQGEQPAALYAVDLTGDFDLLVGTQRHEDISSGDLVDILRTIAEAVEDGESILSPSSLTVQPLSEPVEEPASIPSSN